jgi:Bacterial PH domain
MITDKRVLFANKVFLSGLKSADLQWDKISSVSYETEMVFGNITFHASGVKMYFSSITNADCKILAEMARDKIDSKDSQAPNLVNSDLIGQIERLAALKEKGVLTESEFADQKIKLLNQ